jgi:hypothetical protein
MLLGSGLEFEGLGVISSSRLGADRSELAEGCAGGLVENGEFGEGRAGAVMATSRRWFELLLPKPEGEVVGHGSATRTCRRRRTGASASSDDAGPVRLGAARDAGVLSDDEFGREKGRLLGV